MPAVPRSAAHFADTMETGGAKIEEALARLNLKYQSLFFVAACCVEIASIVALISSFFFFELANFVNSSFLLFFGFTMMLLDLPGSPRWAGRYRYMIRKYSRFLTRLSGKALWFLYLGCLVAVSLWPGSRAQSGMGFMVTAVCTSIFVVFVAVLGLFIAFRKSLRLEKVRKALQVSYRGNSPEVYRKYAITDPSHGMQYEEFNRVCSDGTQGKIQFDVFELAIIFNALDEHQKSAINEREFTEWMAGPMAYL
eukprot:GHVO01034798.1.p1 GENE.GHVO01034798.1~~GHVO01034798.1.p1  ORF type:complete len:252 (+),score=21.63 GHVO01034798.1:66-821(+)